MPDTKERLLYVGGRLAVLGVGSVDDVIPDLKYWHIMRPGTWSAPQIGGSHNAGLVVGKTLCGLRSYSNGYASDFYPPAGSTCPACKSHI